MEVQCVGIHIKNLGMDDNIIGMHIKRVGIDVH